MKKLSLICVLGTTAVIVAVGCRHSSHSGPPAPPSGPSVEITGRVTFDRVPHYVGPGPAGGLDYAATHAASARGVVVEAVWTQGDQVLDSTTSDTNGEYRLDVVAGVEIYIRVRAQMRESGAPGWDCRVVDNTQGDALYVIEGQVFTNDTASVHDLHAPSGWTGSSYGDPRLAAPFAILDTIYEALQTIHAADPNLDFPLLLLHWSELNSTVDGSIALGEIGNTYHQDGSIYILGAENDDTDEYDGHVLTHEYMHFVQSIASRSDSIGGPHSLSSVLDPRVSFGEGFATGMACVLRGPLYFDAVGGQQGIGTGFDVESYLPANPGWFNEASIQAIIYDLYDLNSDGPDTVELDFVDLYDALLDLNSTHALTTMFSYISLLRSYFSDPGAIDTLVESESIVSSTIDVFGTTETNDAGLSLTLPVYKSLVFNGSPTAIQMTDTFGGYNGLGTRQFLRFFNPAAQNVRITVNGAGGTDPDFYLHAFGVIASGEHFGNETLVVGLGAGEYVLEVVEYGFVDGSASGLFDYEVSVTTP